MIVAAFVNKLWLAGCILRLMAVYYHYTACVMSWLVVNHRGQLIMLWLPSSTTTTLLLFLFIHFCRRAAHHLFRSYHHHHHFS